jgi:CRP-like cAMP-binding protein
MDPRSFVIPLPLDDGRANDHGSRRAFPAFAGARTLDVRAGGLLVPEGQRPRSLMVVVSGAVGLSVTGHRARRTLIALLGHGDVIGEEILEEDQQRRVRPETRTLAFTKLALLSPPELHRIMARDPAVAGWLAQSLSRKVDLLYSRLAATLAQGVRERTLALLRSLAVRWGKPSPRGTVVDLHLSQEDLAAMVGTTRESVNRALRDLRSSGQVITSSRRYVIADPSTSVNRSPEADSRATTPSSSNLIKCASSDRAAAGYRSAG